MKKSIFFCFIFMTLQAQNSTLNIAVLDLDPTGIDVEQSRFLSDRLRAELFNTGSFNVIERDKMNAVLEEQGFQQSGCTSVECAVEIGQLLNVQAMVAGTLGKIENLYSINLRLIDVEKGTIIKTATRDFEGSLSDVLTQIIPAVSANLADKEVEKMDTSEPADRTSQTFYKWSVQLKFGSASLNYITDYNDAIKEYNDEHTLLNFDDYPGSTVAGLEIYYRVSDNWRYRGGINFIRQTGSWEYKATDFSLGGVQFERFDFMRQYEFVQLFVGADYIKALSTKFDLIVGADIGVLGHNSEITQRYRISGGENQDSNKKFNYSKGAVKLRVGFDFHLSKRFDLFLYAEPVLVAKFETDERPDTSLFTDFNSVIYPDNINGSGALISIGAGYLF